MGLKGIWKAIKSFYYDILCDFDWEEIMKDPDKRAKVSVVVLGEEILVTISIVIGTLIFIYLVVFT
jgi:hypothetical protein